MAFSFNRMARFAIIIALSGAVAACAPPTASKRDPFATPSRADYVRLASVSNSMVEVDSAGRTVRAAAPDGLCISSDSIQTFRESVFMVIDGCRGARSPLAGVVSVNITNGPLSLDLASMEAHFRSPSGVASLGYGGDPEDIALIEVERTGDAVFATVLDESEFGPAFAGDEICRAFMELNGRMVVVTMTSRRQEPKTPEEMRADMEAVVAALREANA
ncbi:MAG: hypothetical protein AAFP78_10455 [Pseudomonadota bacterium]